MRNIALKTMIVVVAVIGIASPASAGKKNLSRELTQFANEVAARIVYRADTSIKVSVQGCSLHIEYGSIGTAFDTPLQGSKLSETYMEDGIVLQNAGMTRTIKGKASEPFEQLILRFDRANIKTMMRAFDRAVATCSAQDSTVAAVY